MKIGIDAQRLFRKKKFGMDVVVLELIRYLQKADRANDYVVFVAPGENDCIVETENFTICWIQNKLYPVWEQIKLPAAAKSMNVDILHCTANTAPLWSRKPFILTLHDTISLEHRKFQKTKTWYQRIGNQYRRFLIPRTVKKAEHLITVSESEKQNIVRMLHLKPDFVSVVHNGVDERYKPVTDDFALACFRKKYRLPDRYIAFIGNTEPRKNVINMLKAYAEYLDTSVGKKTLAVLHNNTKTFETQLQDARAEHLRNNIVVLGYIDSADMPSFYSGADMFLYPSLREGFGMPILEAMACGTPVITSRTSSMPEVGGEAALYADPTDYKDIAEQMTFLETHPGKRENMIRDGFEQCKKFTWDEAARKVLCVYQKVYDRIKSR